MNHAGFKLFKVTIILSKVVLLNFGRSLEFSLVEMKFSLSQKSRVFLRTPVLISLGLSFE